MRSGAGSRACASRTRSSGTPGRIATRESHELEDALRTLPLPEVGELVTADDEHGIVGLSRLERVDGARVRVELDVDTGDVLERQPRELEARRPRRRRLLCPGRRRRGRAIGRDRARSIAARASATWPICGGSKAPPRIVLLPLERLAFELDLGAALDSGPAERLLELRGRRRSADDAVAAVGAEDSEPRASPRLGPVLEEVRQRPRRRPASRSRPGRARRARS